MGNIEANNPEKEQEGAVSSKAQLGFDKLNNLEDLKTVKNKNEVFGSNVEWYSRDRDKSLGDVEILKPKKKLKKKRWFLFDKILNFFKYISGFFRLIKALKDDKVQIVRSLSKPTAGQLKKEAAELAKLFCVHDSSELRYWRKSNVAQAKKMERVYKERLKDSILEFNSRDEKDYQTFANILSAKIITPYWNDKKFYKEYVKILEESNLKLMDEVNYLKKELRVLKRKLKGDDKSGKSKIKNSL